MNQHNLQEQLNTFLKEKNKNKETPQEHINVPTVPLNREHFNYMPPRSSSRERFQANGDDIDKMVNTLDKVEEVCRRFEQKINDRDEETAEKIRNNMKEQLDKEDEKIQELEELVNVFRQQYLMKESINYRYTKEKMDQLDDTVQNVSDNREKYQDHSKQINMNIDKPIADALVTSLHEFKKKKKNIPTDTDSENENENKK